MSNPAPRRASCALLTASMISLGLLTSGCANQQSASTSPGSENLQIVESRGPLGTTNLDEAAAEAGDPLIVTSNVSVEVGRYTSVTGKDGGRVESKNIFGWAVMPRVVYFRLIDGKKRAEDAVSKANAAAVRAERHNAILDILANACRDDIVCFAAARPRIAQIVGGK